MPFSPAYHFDPDSNLAALNRVSSCSLVDRFYRSQPLSPANLRFRSTKRRKDALSASSINMKNN